MGGDTSPVLAACFDQSFVPHVATLLRSFAESSAGPGRWYLVGDDSVAPSVQRRLVDFARDCGLAAESLRVPDELLGTLDDSGRYPPVIWYRALLAEALPDENRIIYLDSDVLVLHDLHALWQTELGDGDLAAAVCHPSYGWGRGHLDGLGFSRDAPYFNSGVMVMDLGRMRAEEFRRQLVEFATSGQRPQLRFPDQDAMNVVLAGRWTALDPAWNCLSSILFPFVSGASWADDIHHDVLVLERAARSPAIVHFDGPVALKPWRRRSFHPFADLYRRYRAMTPWPLTELEGRRRDALLSRVPPRVQAKLWQLRLRSVAR